MLNLRDEYTIIIVTHNMQQAARVSDRTAFFTARPDETTGNRTGLLVEFNQTSKIFANPIDSAHRGLHLRPLRLRLPICGSPRIFRPKFAGIRGPKIRGLSRGVPVDWPAASRGSGARMARCAVPRCLTGRWSDQGWSCPRDAIRTGTSGPTPKQARGRGWRRTSRGLYVPADVDGSNPEQRIVEAAASPAGVRRRHRLGQLALARRCLVRRLGVGWSGGTCPSRLAVGDSAIISQARHPRVGGGNRAA